MPARVTSSRLIGREAELAELEAALADAGEGRPALVFLAGESGVGKSRLLGAFFESARRLGARAECGECVELGDEELPYGVLVSLLRPVVRERDPALERLTPHARARLSALLPELGGPPAAPEPARAGESGREQLGLFEALFELLGRLAEDRPLVVGLEDIHWADRSTRAFLAFLARNVAHERLLVVATYRTDDLHRRHPLRPLLAELERDPRSRRIELARLSREELATQLGDILGAPGDPELADRLFRRSEGNPLFTEELLAAGLDGRGPAPSTLRDALMVRIERLSPQAQDLLRLLSAGRRLDHATLGRAAALDASTLRAALREAAEANLIVADAQGRYAFRHALLREVVHDDLLPGEHAEMHLALARALEEAAADRGEDQLITAGIAHHYVSAGDQPAALSACVRAAAAAERVHAHGEAAALLERALDLWERVPDAPARAGTDHAGLLARAGRALQDEGRYARAEALLRRAAEEIDAGREPHRAAGALERLSKVLWSLGRAAEARETIARAVAVLPDEDESAERARILTWNAKACMLQGRYAETLPLAREAIAAAERAGAEPSLSGALNAMGVALISVGRVDDGTAAIRRAIDVAGDWADVANGYVNLADALHLVGRGREALEIAHEGLNAPGAAGHAHQWLSMTLSEIAWDIGDWDLARRSMPPADRRYEGMRDAFAALRHAEMALADARHEDARRLLDRARAVVPGSREPQFIGWEGALRAELERRAGDLAAAREAVGEALDAIEFCSEDSFRVARLAGAGVAVEADAARRARDLGDEAAAAEAIARAEGHVERTRACTAPGRPVELARLAEAQALLARARDAGDPALEACAAERWRAVERPYPAALADLRGAELHAEAGERDRAARLVAQAAETAERLGAAWLAAEAAGLARRARLPGPAPASAEASPGPAGGEEAGDPFGLTPREREVLTLLAAGATNREIGAELFMAEKTASVHVSRILAKLGVRSRTEAAGVAHRLGLAGLPRP